MSWPRLNKLNHFKYITCKRDFSRKKWHLHSTRNTQMKKLWIFFTPKLDILGVTFKNFLYFYKNKNNYKLFLTYNIVYNITILSLCIYIMWLNYSSNQTFKINKLYKAMNYWYSILKYFGQSNIQSYSDTWYIHTQGFRFIKIENYILFI